MTFRRTHPPLFLGAEKLNTADGPAPTEYSTKRADAGAVAAIVRAGSAALQEWDDAHPGGDA
jgi:hypothetical protein